MTQESHRIPTVEEAWQDYGDMLEALEEEFLRTVASLTQDSETKVGNAQHIREVAELVLGHSVPGITEGRIPFHVRRELAGQYVLEHGKDGGKYPFNYFDKRLVSAGGRETEFIIAMEGDDGTPLAIKIKKTTNSEFWEAAFRREQNVLSRLNNYYSDDYPPNLIRLYGIGVDITATERIRGATTLERRMKANNSLVEVVKWVKDIAQGLEALYQAGYESHNDLCPNNCILGDDGNVRVSDFSLVRKKPTTYHNKEFEAGKGQYMSPERAIPYCFNEKHPIIDRRSDVFSLAVMTHRFLTKGCDPFGRHRLASADKNNFNMLLASLAQKCQAYNLKIRRLLNYRVSQQKFASFAKNFVHERLDYQGCPYIDNQEILNKLDRFFVRCFSFNLSTRPESPQAFFNEFLEILDPLLKEDSIPDL